MYQSEKSEIKGEGGTYLVEEEQKVILSCLEKKSDDYSLEGQYHLVEEEQKLEV